MKKLLSLLLMATLCMQLVFAAHVGSGIGVDIETERFAPRVWMCGDRVVADDDLQPSLYSSCFGELGYRTANYAFEGESIRWRVLVMDKNGIEKIEDVFATIGTVQGAGNDIEVNCKFVGVASEVDGSCNARILEENLTGKDLSAVAGYYDCTLTVETPESMYGEYFITVEALDLDGLSGTMAENEYWFLNPEIALRIEGGMYFENVRPGTSSYSETILVGNDADIGSGVRLDMFISGTHFYDSSSSGAMCPTTNELNLESFKYYALNGPHKNTCGGGDSEGYCSINPGSKITDSKRIMDGVNYASGGLNYKNLLSPGAEMALTFRLDLPEPCNGDFDSGQIYFWGEAI